MQATESEDHDQQQNSELPSGPLSREWLQRLNTHLVFYGMFYADGEVHGSKGLVANFLPVAIRSGHLRYLSGRPTPLHLVELVRPVPDEARANGEVLHSDVWELEGDLRQPKTWADFSGGKAIVVQPRKFQTLIHALTNRMGIQAEDDAVDRMLMVGTYLTKSGELRVSDGVDFPAGDEECVYSGITFPREGDPGIFDKVASLSTDDTVRATLVWILGAAFKPAFGDAYPHLSLTGDKESGKTTLLQILARRFGLKSVAAPVQFQTSYRLKKTLGNSNIPVLADEVGRVAPSHRRRLVDQLNVAYDLGHTTHGHKAKVYDLYAPVLLAGQDFPVRDEALLAKTVSYHLRGEAKNPEALAELEDAEEVFPLGEWLDFACAYANERDIAELLTQKESLLREKLSESACPDYAEADRSIRNHAMQLVAADALQEYGLAADIEEYIVEALRQHLAMLREEGVDIAEKFVRDLRVLLATRPDPSKTLCDERLEGVFVHVETVLKALRSKGYTYDVSDPRVITRRLAEKGLGKADRHRFGGRQLRCVFIPRQVLDSDVEDEAPASTPEGESTGQESPGCQLPHSP